MVLGPLDTYRPVERSPAPRRVPLGSSTYTTIRAALVDRLAILEAQREVTRSTDADE